MTKVTVIKLFEKKNGTQLTKGWISIQNKTVKHSKNYTRKFRGGILKNLRLSFEMMREEFQEW